MFFFCFRALAYTTLDGVFFLRNIYWRTTHVNVIRDVNNPLAFMLYTVYTNCESKAVVDKIGQSGYEQKTGVDRNQYGCGRW